ncbi:hypothetical protein [Zymobacter palmae]|uniref:hypothetical protein n=1 Tax=Zymobacter palmae TaxID=33074 RepID=UPI00047FAC3D|nr:hypothetical protein [Zymobacter palmae]
MEIYTEIRHEHRRLIKGTLPPQEADQYIDGSITHAAGAYLSAATTSFYPLELREILQRDAKELWPWNEDGWHPSTSPRRNLIRAAAYIVAEIERLERDA